MLTEPQALPRALSPAPAYEHLDAAIEELAKAMAATTMVAQGDAMMLGVEHAARAFALAIDADTARILLARIGESLKGT